MSTLTIDFCGEVHVVAPGDVFSVGREGDLAIDDNPFLHRRLLEFGHDSGFWWLRNVGSRLAVTVSGQAGTLQSWIGPGSALPLVLPQVGVLFTAGDTTYEIDVACGQPHFHEVGPDVDVDGTATLGQVPLTSKQLLLILALAEPTLRRSGTGTSVLPTNVEAATRLGWSITTFNRKLDNVCEKFSKAGVKGLRGDAHRLATNRRARLVEYVVAAKIVGPEHLTLLEEGRTSS
jgi:hypothetical protein